MHLVGGLAQLGGVEYYRVVFVQLQADAAKGADIDVLGSDGPIVLHGLVGTPIDAGEFVAPQILVGVDPTILVLVVTDQAQHHIVAELHALAELRFSDIKRLHVCLANIPLVIEAGAEISALGIHGLVKLGGGQCLYRRGNGPGAVIVTPVVILAATVGKAVATGGLGVAARCQFQDQVILVRGGLGANVHHAAGKVAGILDGIGFLNQQALDDIVRHDIQGHGLLERHRAGYARPVQQGGRIALAQAAHVNVLAAHQAEPRHPGQGRTDVGLRHEIQILRVQHVGDFRGITFFFGYEFAEYEYLLDLHARVGVFDLGHLRRKQGRMQAQGRYHRR